VQNALAYYSKLEMAENAAFQHLAKTQICLYVQCSPPNELAVQDMTYMTDPEVNAIKRFSSTLRLHTK
jgi:hypothetical protein